MANGTHIYQFPAARRIAVAGDIHGYFEQLVYRCCVLYGMTDTLIVVAGDCGFGFLNAGYYEAIYRRCRKRLTEYNNWIVFVRGNHDNPAYFDGQQVAYDRWRAVPNYSVLQACGRTILCVGGAVTIERKDRIRCAWFNKRYQWDRTSAVMLKRFTGCLPKAFQLSDSPLARNIYWPSEAPVYNTIQLYAIDAAYDIDMVISHSAPSVFYPDRIDSLRNYWYKDSTLYSEVLAERQVFDGILTFLQERGHPLRDWYYGHFHLSWNGVKNGVRYHLLNAKEVRLLTTTGSRAFVEPHRRPKRGQLSTKDIVRLLLYG